MIRAYLKYRGKLLFILILCFFFNYLVFYLHQIDFEPFYDSQLILLFLVLIVMGIDFLKYRIKIRHLKLVQKELSLYPHPLPEPGSLSEQIYQEMIQELYLKLGETDRIRTDEYMEQLEYYTRWMHQIKTPISAMRMILESEGGEKAVPMQELFKIEQYVEMALQYVKLSDMSGDLVLDEINLCDVVKHSLKKYAALFIYGKIPLELNEEGMDLMIQTDKRWLSFIIEQLLSNSIKYIRAGEKIQIYMEGTDLLIQDGGIGIRLEDLPRIFEKGYTGYNGRLNNKSSGIGLYMAKRAAGYLSVRIEIVSKLMEGTTARLSFPKPAEFKNPVF